ncbi:acetate/propionate kinase [Escherichia coli]|uniref:Acetate/propionate kinase n=1 Tax=Escherichia coli TaxID=562 RepID=A0A376WVG1_ECOLX|nr:acetate/propionate kinase [Escherichia coli]
MVKSTFSGLAECFHLPEARIKWKMDGNKQEAALGAGAAHSEALNFIVNTILAQKPELSAQLDCYPVTVSYTAAKSIPAP